jgi:NADH-quinone oxidoreductase E subunit
VVDKTLPRKFAKYQKEQNLVSLLKEVQAEYGYLPGQVMTQVAESLDISTGEVYGVGTFYSFFSPQPLGKNIIRICKSVPCYLKDNHFIVEEVGKTLGIKPGETTEDGKFSLQLTNCIGACDKSPAMMINDTVYSELTPTKIAEILSKI